MICLTPNTWYCFACRRKLMCVTCWISLKWFKLGKICYMPSPVGMLQRLLEGTEKNILIGECQIILSFQLIANSKKMEYFTEDSE